METKYEGGSTQSSPEWTDPDDAPELTDEFFADGEVFKGETFVRRGRGRPPTGNAKELISVRLDRDVLARLRQAGPGWQSQVNVLLRQALALDGRVNQAGGPFVFGDVADIKLEIAKTMRAATPAEASLLGIATGDARQSGIAGLGLEEVTIEAASQPGQEGPSTKRSRKRAG